MLFVSTLYGEVYALDTFSSFPFPPQPNPEKKLCFFFLFLSERKREIKERERSMLYDKRLRVRNGWCDVDMMLRSIGKRIIWPAKR